MSEIFVEQSVDLVKFTFDNQTSGTTTLYASKEYHVRTELYGTQLFDTWPLLVDAPVVRRSVGRFVGRRHDVTINLWAHNPYHDGKTFMELWQDDVHVHGASIEVFYYPKPVNGQSTITEPETIQLEAIDIRYNEESSIISIVGRDVWFKDKDLSIPLKSEDFDNLDPRYEGEPGAIVFGRGGSDKRCGGIISSPFIKNWIETSGGRRQRAHIFAGWTFTDYKNGSDSNLPRIYARNTHRNVDPKDWLEVQFPVNPNQAAYGYDSSTSNQVFQSLADYSRAIVFSPPALAHVVTAMRVKLFPTTGAQGTVKCTIYQAEYDPVTGHWAPIGPPLAQKVRTANYSNVATFDIWFPFNKPLLISPDASYMAVVESKPAEGEAPVQIALGGNVGTFHFAKSTASPDTPWERQEGVSAAIGIYVLGASADVSADGYYRGSESGLNAAYFDIEGPTYYSIFASETVPEINTHEYKMAIAGIADRSLGTYTGQGGTLIENPADVLAFVLMNDEFGLGVSSADVSNTDWTDARTKLQSAGVDSGGLKDMTAIIQGGTSGEEFIINICQQARLQFYKARDGQLIIHFPEPLSAKTTTLDVTEERWREDVAVISYADNPADSVINDFQQAFAPDPLNISTDPSITRERTGIKNTGFLLTNKDETNTNSPNRVSKCSNSYALYGKRNYNEPLNFWQWYKDARTTQWYLIDRYSFKHKIATVRLPRKRHHEVIDINSRVKIAHTAFKRGTVHGELEKPPGTFDADGVPSISMTTAEHEGEVVGISYQGPYMFVDVETVSDDF